MILAVLDRPEMDGAALRRLLTDNDEDAPLSAATSAGPSPSTGPSWLRGRSNGWIGRRPGRLVRVTWTSKPISLSISR